MDGRSALTINLQDFTLKEASEILNNKGLDEIFEAYLYVEGIPLYLEVLANAPSVEKAIKEHAFSPNGFFIEEFEKIFLSHFGKNPHYKQILEYLSEHSYGLSRNEISKKINLTNGKGLSDLILDLETAGFISKSLSFDKPMAVKKIKYSLSDPYLRFYFNLLAPVLLKIRLKSIKNLYDNMRQSGAYFDWRGKAFEYLCQRHIDKIVTILGFPCGRLYIWSLFRS